MMGEPEADGGEAGACDVLCEYRGIVGEFPSLGGIGSSVSTAYILSIILTSLFISK